MKTILKRERELFEETWRLRQAGFEITSKKGNKKEQFFRSREIQRKENELYKKQQFFKKYLEEMEKLK